MKMNRQHPSLSRYLLAIVGTTWGVVFGYGQGIPDRLEDPIDNSIEPAATNVAPNESDSLALVQFYDEFNGDAWTDDSGWLDTPLSQWFGVELTNGRVTGIELRENGLWGTTFTEFPQMEFLETIDLRDNNLRALPDFSNLPSLRSVKVDNNILDFEDIEAHINQGFEFSYAPQWFDEDVVNSRAVEGESVQIKRSFGGEFNTYQWYMGSIAMKGETADSLSIDSITPSTVGPYTLEIKNTLAQDLTLRSAPLLYSIVQDSEIEWMDIGAYHHSYNIDGGNTDGAGGLMEGMSYPAIIRDAGHQRALDFAIAVKDWVNPDGREYPFYVYRTGGRLPVFNQPKYTSPIQNKLIGRYEDTRVEVNGRLSTDKPAQLDEVNPALAADRMIHEINRTVLGITMDRKVYAYTNEFHDNYHLIDYEFCNTGNVDGDDAIELPNQTLRNVYFHWIHRWRGSEQAAWGNDSQQAWGRYTIHDVVGDGYADYPVDFQAQYAWTGLSLRFDNEYDNRGGPMTRDLSNLSQYVSVAPEDTVGRLADANMVGRSTIHADRSSIDKTYDLRQPSIMQWTSNDDLFHQVGTHAEVFENTIFRPGFLNDNCADCLRSYPHFADRDYPDGDFWGFPNGHENSGTITWGLSGGLSPTTGFGPYRMGPNECINITVSEGIGGLSYDAATKIGQAYKNNGSSRDTDEISFDANGDGVISDQAFNYDEIFVGTERQTKNQWVMSARDSLFQTFYRARDAFRASNDMSVYPIAEPPHAPSEFKLWSKPPNQIELEWQAASGGPAIQSWELYRTEDREDNLFVTGCLEDFSVKCGYELVATLPAETTTYLDSDLNPNTKYYYYLQGVGFNSSVDDNAISGTPGGIALKSGRYLTQTYTGISPSDVSEVEQEIPFELSLGGNFPNPFADDTKVQYLLSRSAEVRIVVYDILGKRIKTLEMGQQEAGLYNASLEISDLSNGAYVYVIESGEQKVDGMMIKLR